MLPQQRFDLAQFDAESSDLHLVIHPAETLNIPIRAITGEIAASVEPCARFRVQRIQDKLFGIQFGTIQVASGQAISTYIQLSNDAGRHGLQVAVEYVDFSVCDWPSNENRAFAGDDGINSGPDCGFCRTVHVPN